MKKILVLLLLAVFTFNSIGYFAFFVVSQYQARKVMWKSISLNEDQNVLDVIIISDKDRHKADFTRLNKHEFRYKGKMYDIVRSKTVGESIYFYVINDKREQNLFASLKKNISSQIAQTAHPNKDQQLLLYDFIKQLILTQRETLRAPVDQFQYASITENKYENPVQLIPSPPPKLPVFTS